MPAATSALDDGVRRCSISDCSASTDARSAAKQGMPSITELPWKISENDSPMMALKPARARPCGACSRDDPQPKLRLTIRIVAPV